MTNEQAKKMIKAKLECLKRETSGTDFDCNNSNCDECSLCYEQGNMGEQKEALDMAIKALEQQPCEDTISRQAAIDALDEIRHALWEIDIPSPTVPEYIEHHEQVQSVWKLLDKKQKEFYAMPSAQSEPIKSTSRISTKRTGSD